jgi:hypothetical protein
MAFRKDMLAASDVLLTVHATSTDTVPLLISLCIQPKDPASQLTGPPPPAFHSAANKTTFSCNYVSFSSVLSVIILTVHSYHFQVKGLFSSKRQTEMSV